MIDEYTRECLALEVDRTMTASDVVDVMIELAAVRGVPGHIRSDNGPEFIARAIRRWLGVAKVGTLYIEPGSRARVRGGGIRPSAPRPGADPIKPEGTRFSPSPLLVPSAPDPARRHLKPVVRCMYRMVDRYLPPLRPQLSNSEGTAQPTYGPHSGQTVQF